jgi:hypothetical protein
MAEIVKNWTNGGSLSVVFTGDGDGTAVISSTENEGAEREAELRFIDASRSVIVVRRVVQAAGQVSVETYTRLAYIECNGQQYINTGYIVQEDDIIDVDYFATVNAGGEKMVFGSYDGTTSVSWSISSTTGYACFGSSKNTGIARGYHRYNLILSKGYAKNGTASAAPSYTSMPEQPLYLFARNNKGTADYFGKALCYVFRIKKENGDIIKELRPVKRNSDGKVGMLDVIDGTFYISENGVDLIGGYEAQMPSDYIVLDTVDFNNDKIFDTNIHINENCVIEIKMWNGSTSTAHYMYGVVTSDNKASATAYLTRSGTWRFGATYKSINTADADDHILIQNISSVTKDRTRYASSGTQGAFVTPYTLPVGGSVSATGVYSKGFIGSIYYLKITEGENLLLYWLPCRRKSDGVEGFWDCVTQAFVEPM